jgi:uncharacterized protein
MGPPILENKAAVRLVTTGARSSCEGGNAVCATVPDPMRDQWRVSSFALLLLGSAAGAGAGLLAGLIGIGGGIVVVPVVFYGLTASGVSADAAAHIAVGTSLAAILPASIVSFFGHWRAGNTDLRFLVSWGPGITTGVVCAQMVAPHVRGVVLSAIFGLLCLIFAIRFAFPDRFRPLLQQPPDGACRQVAGVFIGACSGFAGIGGGILTNIVMTLSGLPMHKSIGRAAAVGIVVSIPATLTAALASHAIHPLEIGVIDLPMLASIAPAQALAAWFGAGLAPRLSAANLSRVFAGALAVTGVAMLKSSMS